ncbi:PucR family transcriptional regulator [Robertmurraya massiliosenegalensis]|uniref:PucR family transcriptional regulator n=1 Tax=Robertmurraya massiliosenegalensis TaxID=1287657 RepID=UPI00031B8D03|nr:helix-turn-helix domain-containing protein [Robertmurraya massiliosenegalensis]
MVPPLIHDLLMASHDGLSGLANKLSEVLSYPMIITDSFYHVLASSFNKESLEILVSTSFENYSHTVFFTCTLNIEGIDYQAYGYPIKLGNHNVGNLFLLLENEEQLEIENYESIIQYGSSLCSSRIKQMVDLKKESQRYKDAFLFDLLYGNFKNREDILAYGSLWKWDFNQPHAVIVLSMIEYNPYSEDKQLIDTLLYLTEKALVQHGYEPIAIRKQSEVVLILPVNKQTNFTQPFKPCELISYIIKQTKESPIGNRVACGVGQVYENPGELFRSYQEAKVSYEIGLLLKIEIPYFHNMGLERILYKHDLQDLKEYYNHILGPLQKYDETQEGDLMFTLESFAHHQFDLKQTSDAIFLHRNTLRYRIKKIEEILNIKLDDVNNRLNIVAALKIKQLHKI